MHDKTKKGLKVAGVILLLFVLFTIIDVVRPFPLSGCLAPWGYRVKGDQATRNAHVCLMEIAMYSKKPDLCNRFSHWLLRLHCVERVAAFAEDPNVCLQRFLNKKDTRSCLRHFEGKLKRPDLCEKLADSSWRDSCIRAYDDATGKPSMVKQPRRVVRSTPGAAAQAWKTYQSEEYGFELKYPPNWSLLGESKIKLTKLTQRGLGFFVPIP